MTRLQRAAARQFTRAATWVAGRHSLEADGGCRRCGTWVTCRTRLLAVDVAWAAWERS